MNLRQSVLKGGALLAGSQIAVQALRFSRNVILARLLMPADFGVAATFWITTSFLATITQFGFEQMLIRDKAGDDERVGATGQTLLLIRSAIIAAIIFALAGPIMAVFESPEATGAFRLIALSTLLGGFVHRDTVRLQRHMRFGPLIISQLVPEVVLTFLAWPIAVWRGDYTAFVAFALLQGVMSVLVSRLVAERPFRLGWEADAVRRYWSFGWPLLLNSLLMFAVMQGDRVVLARSYTKTELGFYSVAFGLAMTPAGILMGIGSQLMLPTLAKVQEQRTTFLKYYRLYEVGIAATAMAMGILFILVGPLLIHLIYGGKYQTADVVIGWLGVMQALRLLRVAPTTAALSLGDTKNSLIANLFRQVGLGLAVLTALLGGSIQCIAASGVAGEVLAVLSSGVWVRHRHRLPMLPLARSLSLALAAFAASALISMGVGANDWLFLVTCAFVLGTVVPLMTLVVDSGARAELLRIVRVIRSRLRLTLQPADVAPHSSNPTIAP